MRLNLEKLKQLPLRATVAVVVYLWSAQQALAIGGSNVTGNSGANVGNMFDNMSESASKVPLLFAVFAYVGGIGLVVAGLLRFKQYVDDPTRAAMKDALIRFGAGVGLILLPWVVEVILDTLAADSVETAGFSPKLYSGGKSL